MLLQENRDTLLPRAHPTVGSRDLQDLQGLSTLPSHRPHSLILVFYCLSQVHSFSLHLFCAGWVWQGAGSRKKGCGAPTTPSWQSCPVGAATASSSPPECEHPWAAPAAKGHPPPPWAVSHPHVGPSTDAAQGHGAVPCCWPGVLAHGGSGPD